MKDLISKATLLLLCSVFALSSCTKTAETKTATFTYEIRVTAAQSYFIKPNTPDSGIAELYEYTNNEMKAVATAHNKTRWKITETANTKEEAIAACDRRAIAEFDSRIAEIDKAAVAVKTKFEAKKATLMSKISAETTQNHIMYSEYGGALYKADEGALLVTDILKDSDNLLAFKAVGGEK